MSKPIPFEIQLTGSAQGEAAEKNLLLLIKVLRSLGGEVGVKIHYPAVITLDDQGLPESSDIPQTHPK